MKRKIIGISVLNDSDDFENITCEVKMIEDGREKVIKEKLGTPHMLELANEYIVSLKKSKTLIEKNAIERIDMKKILKKNNIRALPFYILSFITLIISIVIPELPGMILYILAFTLGISTSIVANNKIFYINNKDSEKVNYYQNKINGCDKLLEDISMALEIVENKKKKLEIQKKKEQQILKQLQKEKLKLEEEARNNAIRRRNEIRNNNIKLKLENERKKIEQNLYRKGILNSKEILEEQRRR